MVNPIIDARKIQPITRPRVTFNLNMYHQIMGDDARQYQFNGDCLLDVEEVPYERIVVVESDWKPLDFGYLGHSKIRTIICHNITGMERQVNSSTEQKEADATAIVLFSTSDKLCLPYRCPPMIIHLSDDFNGLSVRSAGAPARIKYIGLPR